VISLSSSFSYRCLSLSLLVAYSAFNAILCHFLFHQLLQRLCLSEHPDSEILEHQQQAGSPDRHQTSISEEDFSFTVDVPCPGLILN
jgi:hypothetical protein